MTLHDGHRARMRERFRKDGLDGFAPHEILELLLFYGRARGDVNPLAHQLMDAFGSLRGVLEARPEQLMAVKGVGEETATLLSLLLPVFRRYVASLCSETRHINSREEAVTFCSALLSGWRAERFYVISLGTSNQVLGQRLIAEGTLNEVSAYPRLVIETALNYNAHSVILCHNHPSGACLPSPDDLRVTRRIQSLLEGLGMVLLDHIIVAGASSYSMMREGDLRHSAVMDSLIPENGRSTLLPGSRKNKAAAAKSPTKE